MSKLIHELSNMRESLAMALSAIRASKLRSILTLLGIAVGVFSIIAVMTALGVLRNSIEEGLTQLGANTFQIQKFPSGFEGGPEARRRLRNRKDITFEQASLVRERATLAEAVGLEVWDFGNQVAWKGEKTNPSVQIAGENVDGLVTNDWSVEVGRGLNQQDLDLAAPVAVLGKAVAEKLFAPSITPIGEDIRVKGQVFRVIGVFASKGSALGGNNDSFVAIPITTFFQRFGRADRSVNIMVKARNREVFDDALEQSRAILRAARGVPPGAEDDFAYFSNDSLITQFNEFTLYVRMGVLVVSSIALLAAGVGIMNIMLVSVTERTREIGIRKAVGAQKTDILRQFLIEAVILSEIGGVIGILLGVLGGNVISILMEVPAIFPWDWAAIGIGVCSLVGILFGVYPAWKASSLDPIDSLRYE
jgi:putative ABC transport system permease protein